MEQQTTYYVDYRLGKQPKDLSSIKKIILNLYIRNDEMGVIMFLKKYTKRKVLIAHRQEIIEWCKQCKEFMIASHLEF